MVTKKFKKILALSFLLTLPTYSHTGAGIKSGPLKGCHQDRKNNNFHCHNHPDLKDGVFASQKDAMRQVSPSTQVYYRKDWKHWSDEDGNCLNTRQEILKSRSLKPVVLNKKGCSVVTGYWRDFYFDQAITSAADADIDHVVPLSHAHNSGGANWDKYQKQKFANDPDNLVITSKKGNRSKGSKTITEWLPLNKDYACLYITRWMQIKRKYQLTISPQELETQARINCI